MVAPVTPTTSELTDNIRSQIEAAISQATPLLPKSFVRVLSAAIAAVVTVLYKYIEWMFNQFYPSTADFEESTILGRSVSPLKQLGNLIGKGDPKTGTAAELTFTVTVTNQTGTLPIQSQITNPATGYIYVTTSNVPLNAATVSVDAVAISGPNQTTGAGADGNAANGTVMRFVNSLSNVQRDVVVSGTVTQGADAETVDQYRDDVEQLFANRPQGGAPADYVQWGKTVDGIVDILPYKGLPGQVNVYVEATEASSGSSSGIPTQAQLDAVYNAIQFNQDGLATRRPLGSFVNTLPITRTLFNVTIDGLSVSDISTTQSQISDTLTTFFNDRSPFIAGVTSNPRADIINSSTIIGAVEDVVTANNGTFTTISLFLASAPLDVVALYVLSEGEKSKLNTVSYT